MKGSCAGQEIGENKILLTLSIEFIDFSSTTLASRNANDCDRVEALDPLVRQKKIPTEKYIETWSTSNFTC